MRVLTISGVVWICFGVDDYWPFVLQCPGSPLFIFAFVSLLMGALIWWSRWCWLWGIFIFDSAAFLWWSRSFGPRCVRILFLQCSSPFDGVDLLDPEACEFFFCSALLLMASIFWTPRHEFISYSALPLVGALIWWSRSFWPRGVNLFFTVLSCGEVDLVDPEARI